MPQTEKQKTEKMFWETKQKKKKKSKAHFYSSNGLWEPHSKSHREVDKVNPRPKHFGEQ